MTGLKEKHNIRHTPALLAEGKVGKQPPREGKLIALNNTPKENMFTRREPVTRTPLRAMVSLLMSLTTPSDVSPL